jgi:hypothetical protein
MFSFFSTDANELVELRNMLVAKRHERIFFIYDSQVKFSLSLSAGAFKQEKIG